MNEREYLVSKGLAKPGRGRFSKEAKAELERVRAAGMKFEASATAPTEKVVLEIPPMTWPNHMAVTESGQNISMKNCCFTCSVSLHWCECGKPTALNNRGTYEGVRFVEVR